MVGEESEKQTARSLALFFQWKPVGVRLKAVIGFGTHLGQVTWLNTPELRQLGWGLSLQHPRESECLKYDRDVRPAPVQREVGFTV